MGPYARKPLHSSRAREMRGPGDDGWEEFIAGTGGNMVRALLVASMNRGVNSEIKMRDSDVEYPFMHGNEEGARFTIGGVRTYSSDLHGMVEEVCGPAHFTLEVDGTGSADLHIIANGEVFGAAVQQYAPGRAPEKKKTKHRNAHEEDFTFIAHSWQERIEEAGRTWMESPSASASIAGAAFGAIAWAATWAMGA